MNRHRSRAHARVVLAFAALAALGTLLTTGPAQAQVIAGESDQYQSPQHFAFEIRLGPYKPDVDSEFGAGGPRPYQDFFGSGNRLMSQIEFDYQFIRHVGSVALGIGVGYFSVTGHNRDMFQNLTADTSTLKLIPFSLSAVYRFDLLYERLHIPLVPYGKLGLDYAIWTINDGNGEVPTIDGGTGRGGTWGWHAAAGLSFVLDYLEPVTARQFDSDVGVNHTHVFVELDHWDISGLGSSDRLHVGDNTWMAGLLFEF